jgi:branched-chain amino acid transport system permease protein
VTRTRWGKAMRATAQDRETAQAMGIDVERTILLTFFVGGALAGAAGLIQGMYYNIGMWWMGYQAGLRAFTAAVLGGIGNMPRRRARRPLHRIPLGVERPVHLRPAGPTRSCSRS